ncbi:MAG: AhpC/TSA family protein [Acidimicrobiales bacterium]
MRDHLPAFGDAEIVVVMFASQRILRGYRARFADPLLVVTDEERAGYRAFGLGRGPWWRVYGWATIRRYAQLMRQGRRFERPRAHDDTLQLGGDFVIAADGRVAYAFRSTGPDDRPPVDDLINAVANGRSAN